MIRRFSANDGRIHWLVSNLLTDSTSFCCQKWTSNVYLRCSIHAPWSGKLMTGFKLTRKHNHVLQTALSMFLEECSIRDRLGWIWLALSSVSGLVRQVYKIITALKQIFPFLLQFRKFSSGQGKWWYWWRIYWWPCKPAYLFELTFWKAWWEKVATCHY